MVITYIEFLLCFVVNFECACECVDLDLDLDLDF